MEFDPHTLQQILQRIYQHMRCPQCGKKIPVDIASIRVVGDGALLLQLKCDDCRAHIVLQASLQGVEEITAPPYEENLTANISSGFEMNDHDVDKVRNALTDINGSFEDFFKDRSQPSKNEK